MRKFIAIWIIAAFMMSSTEAAQLLKVPFLFQHFLTHQQENPRLSFLGFLSMHYLHGSPQDKDYSDDMKLPFKSANTNLPGASIVVVIPAPLTWKPAVHHQQATRPQVVHRDGFIPLPHLAAVWQPPRFC